MKVLLVEPDRHMVDVITLAFERVEHDVFVATTAQTALDALDTFGPDVVVLELQLGKHNGIEFLYEQHSYADWKDVPVIVHTLNQHAKDASFQKAWKQLGVKDILYKPETSVERLRKIVENL